MNFDSRIYSNKFKLNDTDNIIIDYVKENSKEIVNMSIHQLSKDLFLSPNTIMRFCKKIGYSGFAEMKFSLNKTQDESKTIVNKVLERLPSSVIRTIDIIDEEVLIHFVNKIVKANKILFVGVGDSSFQCELIGRSLKFVGINTEFYGHIHDMEYVASKLTPEDLVIFISGRGANERLLKIAKGLNKKGVPALAITKYGTNPLSELCDEQLCYWSEEKNYNDYMIVDRVGLSMLLQMIIEDVCKEICVKIN
ncbi:MAG: MurR/RpiR family transcriptional regulator [bacterium]